MRAPTTGVLTHRRPLSAVRPPGPSSPRSQVSSLMRERREKPVRWVHLLQDGLARWVGVWEGRRVEGVGMEHVQRKVPTLT